MARIEWDKTGERLYETGLSRGVYYGYDGTTKKYKTGVPWNGLTSINETPSGAEPTELWADDQKYAVLRSAENFGGTIEAYTYPPEFGAADGSAQPVEGVEIAQQARDSFGMSYTTKIGSDQTTEAGYKIHLVYGASVSPSEKTRQTINDSPEAATFSWEFTSNPVNVTGYKPTAHLTIDSTKISTEALTAIENKLFGGEDSEATLLMPDEVIAIIRGNGAAA